jgi:hypothetical protein
MQDMKVYMKKKEVEDSKSFSARRLRAIEKAREKEVRRAEYDPEGFFRPGTSSSAASVVRLPTHAHKDRGGGGGGRKGRRDSASEQVRASVKEISACLCHACIVHACVVHAVGSSYGYYIYFLTKLCITIYYVRGEGGPCCVCC